MFVGAVPMPVVNQLLRSAKFETWREIFVCCSGSFRVDRALKEKHPTKIVRGNDVSLVSCALGGLLTDRPFEIAFTGRLSFFEDCGLKTFPDRVAAVLVALSLARFAGKNEYAKGHFAHVERMFPERLAKAKEKVTKLLVGVKLDDFYAGDFRDHAKRAMESGAGIAGFCPTYRGGYERLYHFIDANTEWTKPSFRTWDPKDLPDWLTTVEKSESPYCVITDHELAGFKAVTEYRSTINKPIYGYVGDGKASFRRVRNREASFAYEKVDALALGPMTEVELVLATSAQLTFLRNMYLAKGIAHAVGVANYLVMLDGKLAGGFIYSRDRWDPAGSIYLLSDFCIVHERRLAKLIAMLAVSSETVGAWCKRFVVRPKVIRTTAFTDQPVSMKYRGIFQLSGRKPGQLNYECEIKTRTAKAIYLDWLGRYGTENANQTRRARRSQAARQERALHGGAGVQPPG